MVNSHNYFGYKSIPLLKKNNFKLIQLNNKGCSNKTGNGTWRRRGGEKHREQHQPKKNKHKSF